MKTCNFSNNIIYYYIISGLWKNFLLVYILIGFFVNHDVNHVLTMAGLWLTDLLIMLTIKSGVVNTWLTASSPLLMGVLAILLTVNHKNLYRVVKN